MSLIRITDPTSRCITVAEAKEFKRIRGSTAEDPMIQSFIALAEDYAENYMKRSIMPQQWRLTIDSIPADNVIELPRGPLSTISSAVSNFSYYNSTNATVTMPSTAYTVDTNSFVPRIYLTYDSEWPSNIRSHKDSVQVEYHTGYKDKNSVPEDIRTWVRLRTAAYIDNREPMTIGSGNFLTELPRSFIDGLLDRHTISNI